MEWNASSRPSELYIIHRSYTNQPDMTSNIHFLIQHLHLTSLKPFLYLTVLTPILQSSQNTTHPPKIYKTSKVEEGGKEERSPNPQPLLNRPPLPLPIHILPVAHLLPLPLLRTTSRNRRLVINGGSTLTRRLSSRLLLQPMRNPILPPLLRVLNPLHALLARLHRRVLHVHPEDGHRARHGRKRRREEVGPGREEVREG